MVLSNYQASLSILKFTLPARTDPLCQKFPLTLPCSYKLFCSIRGRINLGHIPYLFISWLPFRTMAVNRKIAFSVTDDWHGIFCDKIQIHWHLIKQVKHKIWKPLKILSLSLTFQNLIVPAALDNVHSVPPQIESNRKSLLKNFHCIMGYFMWKNQNSGIEHINYSYSLRVTNFRVSFAVEYIFIVLLLLGF